MKPANPSKTFQLQYRRNMSDQVDVINTFSDEYREVLKEIEEEGNCPAPFCLDQGNGHKYPIELKTKLWKVTRNSFNYQNAEFAFLLIPKRHVESFYQISKSEWLDFRTLIKQLVFKHRLKGYSLLWRMGEKSHTGASVSHLHAHLICGTERPNKDPKEMTENEVIKAVVAFNNKA